MRLCQLELQHRHRDHKEQCHSSFVFIKNVKCNLRSESNNRHGKSEDKVNIIVAHFSPLIRKDIIENIAPNNADPSGAPSWNRAADKPAIPIQNRTSEQYLYSRSRKDFLIKNFIRSFYPKTCDIAWYSVISRCKAHCNPLFRKGYDWLSDFSQALCDVESVHFGISCLMLIAGSHWMVLVWLSIQSRRNQTKHPQNSQFRGC